MNPFAETLKCPLENLGISERSKMKSKRNWLLKINTQRAFGELINAILRAINREIRSSKNTKMATIKEKNIRLKSLIRVKSSCLS